MSQLSEPAATAVDFINAWASGDAQRLTELLADDVTFDGPTARAEGAADVLAEILSFSQLVQGVEIIGVSGNGDEALIMYEMATEPFGRLRAADYLVIRDGKIVVDKLVFDSYEVRKTRT